MPEGLPPQAFFGIIGFLNSKKITPEIVAGQAVNLWAQKYQDWDSEFSPLRPKLTSLHPFVSNDMEFLAGTMKAMRKHPLLLSESAQKILPNAHGLQTKLHGTWSLMSTGNLKSNQ